MAWTLVTGASSGIGEQFALQLARRGHNVVLVARNAERLEAVARSCEDLYGISTQVIVADLTAEDGLRTVVARLEDASAPIDLLVNNAGHGTGASFVSAPVQAHEHMLKVMVNAVMVLSHAAARQMVRRGHGAICNISSGGAYMTLGAYSAHKTWVDIFTQVLHYELRGTGVTATAVRPGFTDTAFFDRIGVNPSWVPGFLMSSPALVARKGLEAVSRGKRAVVPDPATRFGLAALKIVPPAIKYRVESWIHSHLLPL